MGDTLEIFGKEFTEVAGIKAKDGSGNTLTYTRGGGGGGPTYSIIVPEQTISVSEMYTQITTFTEGLIEGETYRITLDGTEYTDTAINLYGSLGIGYTLSGNKWAFEYSNNNMFFDALDSSLYGTHVIKVEKQTSSGGGGITPTGTINITTNGTHDVTNYASANVNVSSEAPTLQARTGIVPTTSSQTITADSGYDGLSSVQIDAMPSGTAGTPSATKGTVSNHSITVTPSVTNTTGYITGGTKTGTAVTVSASELVSGSETKTANDTYDVTNLAELVVNVPTGTARSSSDLTVSGATVTVPAGLYSSQATKSVESGSAGTPTATKGTVSNHSITVTPSVTNTTGYITGGTKTGTGVTVSASELVSGSQTITANGTVNVTNLASVDVALTFSTITTSSSSPTGGSNGDIWIKTS